ncbi:hypothetical protein HDU81_010646, partial [Chytriomyces hyalinus]
MTITIMDTPSHYVAPKLMEGIDNLDQIPVLNKIETDYQEPVVPQTSPLSTQHNGATSPNNDWFIEVEWFILDISDQCK